MYNVLTLSTVAYVKIYSNYCNMEVKSSLRTSDPDSPLILNCVVLAKLLFLSKPQFHHM